MSRPVRASSAASSSADGTRCKSFVKPQASSTGASVGSNAPSVAFEMASAVSISFGSGSSAPYETVSPFAALSGHEDAIRETARLTTERAELSESRKEELNEQLVWLREHPDARERGTVTYFRPDAKKAGGAYVTVTGAVKKIDEYEKTLWMEDGTVIAIEELSAVEIPGKDRYEEE